ncbi:MAG: SH3 domain-containing protein [Candidatus Aminicenantes bacterium]|nr:SH3 domain-containing protein [Candidatus Aminicenantes bacterium]
MNIFKRSLWGIFLFVLMSGFIFSNEAIDNNDFEIRVIVERTSVRLKPDAESAVLAQLTAGIILEAVEKFGEWYRVKLPPDENGFVVVGFIKVDDVEIIGEEKEKKQTKEIQKAVPPPPPIPKTETVKKRERETRYVPPPPPQPRDVRREVPREAEAPSPSVKGQKGGLNIKISGGMGYLLDGGGDLESIRTGTQNLYSDIAGLSNYTSRFDWNKLSFAPDISAELILDFAKYFGIGFGAGYISTTSQGDVSWDCDYTESSGGVTSTYDINDTRNMKYKISALPITVNLYFFMPGSSFSMYVYGGLGMYMGKLAYESYYDYLFDYTSDSTFEYENPESGSSSSDATCNKLGFNGGLGFIYKISPSFGLGLEIYGRMVNLNDWEGDSSLSHSGSHRFYTTSLGWYLEIPYEDSDSASGKYWFYKSKTGFTSNYYEMMTIAASKPTASYITDARQAEVNLNNFGVKLSIIIRFGLF